MILSPRQGYSLLKQCYRVALNGFELYRGYGYWRGVEKSFREDGLERLEAAQWCKFKKILDFAYHRIPVYNDKYQQAGVRPEDIRTRDDLPRLPVLTKDDIRQGFPDRMLDDQRHYKPGLIGQTSGSTGESLHFVRPFQNWKRSLATSVFLRTGTVSNLPTFVLTTPICTPTTCSLSNTESFDKLVVRKLQGIGALRHLGGPISLPSMVDNVLCPTDEYMEELWDIFSRFPACLIVADPVYLGSFARYLKNKRRALPEVKAIITTYELLTGSLRDLLESVFDCEVFVQYGASELNDIAAACNHHTLHLRMDIVLVEATRGGESVPDGEMGRAIITDLFNYNMPIIRYDIGDVISLRRGGEPCACGKKTHVVESIHGRVNDTMQNCTKVLTPLLVDDIVRGLGGIAAYRLVQKNPDSYTLFLMKDGSGTEIDEQEIAVRARKVLGEDSSCEQHYVDEIRPETSKKFRFAYSEVTAPSW